MLKKLTQDVDSNFLDLCWQQNPITLNKQKIYKAILEKLQGKYNFILNIDNILDVLYNITKNPLYLQDRLKELKPLADSLKYKKKIVTA